MSCASECVGRCAGGSIEVQNREVVDQLVTDAENSFIKQTLTAGCDATSGGINRPRSRSLGNSRPASRGCRLYSHIATVPDDDPDFSLTRPWLNSKLLETLQMESNPDCRTTKECYDGLLQTEDLYRQDFEFLGMDQMILNRRRQEMLHKKWTENVYEPIRCEVEKEVNGPELKELQARKRQLYKEYLEHINKKGHVFLDVGDPAEYFAFSLNPSQHVALKARTGPLNDPLLFQERERNKEDATAIRCMTGYALGDKDVEQIRLPPLPLVPLGRHGISWKRWNDMQLGQIESPVRSVSRRKMRPDRNHSNVSLSGCDAYLSPVGDSEFVYVNLKKCLPNTESH